MRPAFVEGHAPTQADIAAAVRQLRSADSQTLALVERIATHLSPASFAATVEMLERRRQSGAIDNDAGYFVQLLRLAVREQARAAVAAADAPPASQPVGIERIKREEPERYLRAMARTPGFDPVAYLETFVADERERQRLLGLAAELEQWVPVSQELAELLRVTAIEERI